MPDLNAYSRPSLVERVPASQVSASWKNFAIINGIGVLLLCIAMGLLGLREGWPMALGMFALFAGCGFPLLVGITFVQHHATKAHLPTVELQADQIVVTYGNRTKTAKVSECHFHLGRAIHVRLIGGGRLHSWLPVILIDLPPESFLGPLRLRPKNVVAVGYSDETQQKWEQALSASVNPSPLTRHVR